MSVVQPKPAEDCRFDLVALGEVMLRFDPGDGRITTTRLFAVSEGGGEYNVARGLRRCFGMRTALVSAFADNAVGRLLEDLILQGGVDQRHVTWLPYDGVGRSVRNGLNFVERGFGVRAAAAEQGLTFVPLVRERYYFAIRARNSGKASHVRFVDALRSPAFAKLVRRLPGYDVTGAGTVSGIEVLRRSGTGSRRR